MIGEPLAAWLPIAGSLAWKSLLVFVAAAAALWGLRRASAALRHLVCLLTLTALLTLPVLSLALPGWRLPVLRPTPAQAPSPPETGGVRGVDTVKGAASNAPTPHFAAASSSPVGTIPSAAGRQSPSSPLRFPPIKLGEGGEPQRAGTGSFPWSIVLSALWLAGLLLAGLRPLLGLWGIAGLSRASAPVTDPDALALADECAEALGLTSLPILRQADAPVPMTWGGRHPVVLLPLNAPTWPDDRLRAVLLHELAHVRRRDWLSHRFADFVCALYWFHPFVWLIARRLRAESEIACDDLVLTSGLAAPDYARHLLAVARALRPPTTVPQTAIAMARTTQIEGRLQMILDPVRSRQALTRRVLLFVLTPGVAALVLLAMLRPAAKAQATPASVPTNAAPVQPKAPEAAAPPVPATSAPPAVLPATAAPSAAPLPAASSTAPVPPSRRPPADRRGAQLPPAAPGAVLPSPAAPSTPVSLSVDDLKINGASLLAGVTDADKPGESWWSANGALLPAPVYDTKAYRAENHAGADTHNVIFAFRLPGAAQDVTVQYDLPHCIRSSSDGYWPTKIRENAQRTEAQIFAQTSGARVITAAYPPSLTKAGVRIGIASGAWKTVAAINAARDPSGLLREENGTKFLLSPLAETKSRFLPLTDVDSTTLTVATDTADDVRVVAIDTQGQEVLPIDIGGNSIGTLDQITARFALRLAQIKEVRVETRKFQWIEIKDIALQPAHSAQAQSLRLPIATLPPPAEYGLIYFYLPDKSHPGRSHWRWVLQESGHPPYPPHGSGRLPHPMVEVKSLNDPLLTAYISRIPAGKSIGMAWQFKKSDLAHQAGLTGLQQLCMSRKIGFHIDTWLSSYAEADDATR